MKIITALFETLANWLEKKATPTAVIMQERVDRERYSQRYEVELERLKHLREADRHWGAAQAAEATLARLNEEAGL